jgi:hypothetical protein
MSMAADAVWWGDLLAQCLAVAGQRWNGKTIDRVVFNSSHRLNLGRIQLAWNPALSAPTSHYCHRILGFTYLAHHHILTPRPIMHVSNMSHGFVYPGFRGKFMRIGGR